MKRKILIGTCSIVALVIAIFSTIHLYNTNTENKSESSDMSRVNSVGASFSEIRLSSDELITKSELVVRCVFSGKKETKERTTMTKGEDGKEYSFTAPVTTYKMKPLDILKGKADKYINVVTVGGEKNFESGDEYVLFLIENKSENTYTLVSYSQGLTKVKKKDNGSEKSLSDLKDEEIEIVSTEGELTELKQLKEKIKELEK